MKRPQRTTVGFDGRTPKDVRDSCYALTWEAVSLAWAVHWCRQNGRKSRLHGTRHRFSFQRVAEQALREYVDHLRSVLRTEFGRDPDDVIRVRGEVRRPSPPFEPRLGRADPDERFGPGDMRSESDAARLAG